MRIITWNVNGLRSALRKRIQDWLLTQSPDVLCLQEIRVQPKQLNDEEHRVFESFGKVYWNPGARSGYSGVATLLRDPPLEVSMDLGEERFDQEGRMIITRHSGFWLFNVYFPNGQRDRSRVPFKLDFYAHLLKFCDQLYENGERVILCGDFNTAHCEIDLRNPKQNQNTSGFLPEEREWIDHYLNHGFVDVYRELYPGKIQYTWWTNRFNARERNIGWRLDYFLVSKPLMLQVEDVVIHEDVAGSDHCPVTLVLKP